MKPSPYVFVSTVAAIACLGVSTHAAQGFTDTPMQPNGRWQVHDPARPLPKVIEPGATFSRMAAAPSDAVVLFDGNDFSKWTGEKGDVKWKIENDCMESTRTGRIRTKDKFGDFQFHIEWATHSDNHGGANLPDLLRWIWKDDPK